MKLFNRSKKATSYIGYKQSIIVFFEGVREYNMEPIVDLPVTKLGITNFEFKRIKKELQITITLQRPGLLIGKHGGTINSLTKYLSNKDLSVKILVKESNVWK